MKKINSRYLHYFINFLSFSLIISFLLLALSWKTFSKNIQSYQIARTFANENYDKVLVLKQKKIEALARGHIETPESVKSIYISSWVAGHKTLRERLISMVDETSLNSVIIDIKDSTGVVSFPLDENTYLKSFNTDSKRITDIKELINVLHEKDIYVIGRLTAFQDPLLSKRKPELSFSRVDNGETWTDRKQLAFINPKQSEAWEYLAELAKYSYSIGFDEINFDYIRYPSDGNLSNINYELPQDKTRSMVMKSFYEFLDSELRTKNNIPISADLFGLTTNSENDLGIGQIFEEALPYFDAIAPMVYPSHYSSGYFGFENPNENPYGVLRESMIGAIEKATLINEDIQKIRPWIQDFSLEGVNYGVKEVSDQIRAAQDLGLKSYMVWDPKNKYTYEAYK